MSGDATSDFEPPGQRLERACRATFGDSLRSIVYFTRSEFEQVYLRDDLESEARLETFVANERVGFDRMATYEGSELGAYRFTVHGFDGGYLARVVGDGEAVFVTADESPMARFEELVDAVGDVLDEAEAGQS